MNPDHGIKQYLRVRRACRITLNQFNARFMNKSKYCTTYAHAIRTLMSQKTKTRRVTHELPPLYSAWTYESDTTLTSGYVHSRLDSSNKSKNVRHENTAQKPKKAAAALARSHNNIQQREYGRCQFTTIPIVIALQSFYPQPTTFSSHQHQHPHVPIPPIHLRHRPHPPRPST